MNSILLELSFEKMKNSRDIEKIFSYQQRCMYFCTLKKWQIQETLKKYLPILQEIDECKRD
jgi:hypothetical protein